MLKREARNALVGCLIIYTLMFLALLGFRLQTRQYYLSKAAAAAAATTPQRQQPTHDILPSSTAQAVVFREPALAPYQAPIRKLTQELVSARGVLERNVEQLQYQMTALDALATKHNSVLREDLVSGVSVSDNNDNVATTSLQRLEGLLAIERLDHQSDSDDLKFMFDAAISELVALLEQHSVASSSWELVENVMAGAADHLREASSELICPNELVQGQKSAKRKKQVHPNPALLSDLEKRLAFFDKAFQKRLQGSGISALLPVFKEQVEEDARKSLQTLLGDIMATEAELSRQMEQAKLASTNTEAPTTFEEQSTVEDCVDRDYVADLVTAGLGAQLVGDEVREALLKVAIEHNPAVARDDSLILDADLPLKKPVKDDASTETSPTMINLREMIDSPLLVKSIEWIDQFVELIGGHIDRLDLYIDSLVDHGSASVGEVVVTGILERAGLVNIDPQDMAQKFIPRPVKEGIDKLFASVVGATQTKTK